MQLKKQYNTYVFTRIVNETLGIVPEYSLEEVEAVFMAFTTLNQNYIIDMFLEGVDDKKIAIFKERYDEKLKEINESDHMALEEARKRKALGDCLFLLKQRFIAEMFSEQEYCDYEKESMQSIAIEDPDLSEDEILKQFIARSEQFLKEATTTPKY